MGSIQWAEVEKRLKWEATPQGYDLIRTVWFKHCDTEEKQDMEGLLSTLTDDCAYTVLRTDAPETAAKIYKSKEGARQFYTELFKAFPEQNWKPEAVVIGPQGVFSAVVLNSKQMAPWAGLPATGKFVSIRMFVYFIWSPENGRFAGEIVYIAPFADKKS